MEIRAKPASRVRRGILILLLILAVGLFPRAGDRDVVFVVPNDFHGFILLLEDPDRGIEVSAKSPVLSILPSGVLRVRSFTFFPKDWYTQVPRRANGTTIPTYFPATLNPTKTYFLSLGSTDKDQMFFVGTGAECLAFRAKPFKAFDLMVEVLNKEAKAGSSK